MRRSIAGRYIYLRWTISPIFIGKKYQICTLRGQNAALFALSMAKKTHDPENY
jgi:hypothetical protein